jgi:hypothetical protein
VVTSELESLLAIRKDIERQCGGEYAKHVKFLASDKSLKELVALSGTLPFRD